MFSSRRRKKRGALAMQMIVTGESFLFVVFGQD
jgi:hypothetical protein